MPSVRINLGVWSPLIWRPCRMNRLIQICRKKKKHATNFVVASVVCPNCISSGSWQQSLQGKPPCNVCGEHRNIAFCQRSFRETEIDKQVITSHPLRAFTKWILYELPLKYDTVAISHYGGKPIKNYCLILLLRSL